jgi:hypothetical protein
VEDAIDRIMRTYALLANRSVEACDDTRAKVSDYLTKLFDAGEKDRIGWRCAA